MFCICIYIILSASHSFWPVGQFQPNFTDLWTLKSLQDLWKQAIRSLWKPPRPRLKCLSCNRYSCYLIVTHSCLHLLQLHVEWTEHQNRGRLRNTMVKIAVFPKNLLAGAVCELSYLWYKSQASLFITVKLPQIYTVKTENKRCLCLYLVAFSGKSEGSSAANC